MEILITFYALETGKEIFHFRLRSQMAILPGEREKAVSQGPGFDKSVVDKDHQRAKDADDAEVFDEAVLPSQAVEYPRGCPMLKSAAIAAQRPLDPHQRYA